MSLALYYCNTTITITKPVTAVLSSFCPESWYTCFCGFSLLWNPNWKVCVISGRFLHWISALVWGSGHYAGMLDTAQCLGYGHYAGMLDTAHCLGYGHYAGMLEYCTLSGVVGIMLECWSTAQWWWPLSRIFLCGPVSCFPISCSSSWYPLL